MKKSYIIAAVVVVLIAATAFALPNITGMFAKMDPAMHLLYASKNLTDVEKVNATIEVSMAMKSEGVEAIIGLDNPSEEESKEVDAVVDYINSILENTLFKYDMTYAQKKMQVPSYFAYDMDIDYRDDKLLNIAMVFEPWKISMGSEQLYDKLFTVDINDALEVLVVMDSGREMEIDISKYFDVLLNTEDDLYKAVESNVDPYVELIKSYLEENVEKLEDGIMEIEHNGNTEKLNVTNYRVSLDMDIYGVKLKEAAVIAKEDENLKALIKDRLFKVVDLFIESGDCEMMGTSIDMIENDINYFKDTFDEGYEAVFDAISDKYERITAEELERIDMAYEMVYSIDKNNMPRKIDIVLKSQIYDIVESVVINAVNDDVVIEPVNYDETVDVVKWVEDPMSAQEISEEVVINGVENILNGDALNNLMMDLEINAEMLPDEIRDEFFVGIQQYFQMLPYLITPKNPSF